MASQKTDGTPEAQEATQPETLETDTVQSTIDVGAGRTESYETTRSDGKKLRVTRNLDTGQQKTVEV